MAPLGAGPVTPSGVQSSPFLFEMEDPLKKPGAQPAPPPEMDPFMPTAPPGSPFGDPNGSKPMDFGELDFGGPPPPAPSGRASAPPPAAAPAPADDPFDFAEPPPKAPPAPPPPAAPSRPKPAPAPAPAAAASVEASVIRCRTCNKEITDPFDQALGVCDDCRAAEQEKSAAEPKQDPRRDDVPATPLARLSAPSMPAVAAATDESKAEVKPAASAPRRQAMVQTAMRDGAAGGNGRLVGIGLGVAALLGLGVFLMIKKPWASKPPPLAQRAPSGATRPIERAADEWRLKYDDLKGTSADHLAAGELNLGKDTSAGYLDAEEDFQKALVLDKSSDRAIAGWALALAFGRGSQMDDEMANLADALLKSAEQRGGTGIVYTAHAHLMLARNGNANDIKVMAERGADSPNPHDRALAWLALGQMNTSKNPQYAANNFAEALKLEPTLKRAYLAQAHLNLSLGRYSEAIAGLNKRIELDPAQWDASDALARLYVDIGEVAKAKALYASVQQADPLSFRARLALAVLAYQHENQLDSAQAQLAAIVADEDKLEARQLVEALGHFAAVKRLNGDLAGAIEAAEKGIGLKSEDPHVNLQRFFAALDEGKPPEARAQWDFVKGRLGDAALEKTLEGRLLFAEGKFTEALQAATAAWEKDARRTDALLLGAAAAARAKNEGKAWELSLKRGLKADPLYGAPRPSMARLYVRPADVLRAAKGSFELLSKEAEDPNPPMAEGLLAWHSGDWAAAEREFSRVVSYDTANGNGFAFKSLLALRRKENAQAVKLAAKAIDAERQLGLAHAAHGLALAAANQPDLAKRSLQKAFELEPKLLLPKVRFAEIEAKQKKIEDARKTLTVVLLADPTYAEAKRVLHTLP